TDAQRALTDGTIANNHWQQPEAAPGAYIVIADDMASDAPPPNPPAIYTHYAGMANGRVYRLGAPIDVANGVWELDPSAGLKSIAENLPRQLANPVTPDNLNALHDPLPRAYIIGSGLTDPKDMYNASGTTRAQTSGAAQDV